MSDILENHYAEPAPSEVSEFFGPEHRSREEVAVFLLLNADKVLRRIRGKLRAAGQGNQGPGGSARWCVDAEDVLSTVVSRIDRAVLAGRLRTQHEAEFWAYIGAVTENAVMQRLRSGAPTAGIDRRTAPRRSRPSHDAPHAEPPAETPRGPEAAAESRVIEIKMHAPPLEKTPPPEMTSRPDGFAALIAAAPTDSDRALLCSRARGASYAAIAAETGRSEQALRTQWSKLRAFLRSHAWP